MAFSAGFIGLGIMGSRMAANLQTHGHRLIVFNRSRNKADALARNGAIWGESLEVLLVRSTCCSRCSRSPMWSQRTRLDRAGSSMPW